MRPLLSAVVRQLTQTCAGPVHAASVSASAFVHQSCWLKRPCFLSVCHHLWLFFSSSRFPEIWGGEYGENTPFGIESFMIFLTLDNLWLLSSAFFSYLLLQAVTFLIRCLSKALFNDYRKMSLGSVYCIPLRTVVFCLTRFTWAI